MKKIRFVGLAVLVLLSLASCGKKNAAVHSLNTNAAPVWKPSESVYAELDSDSRVNFKSFSDYFTPDYTPQVPDAVNAPQDLVTGGSAKKGSATSDSVIPGVRKLSEYITQYKTERADPARYTAPAIQGADTASKKNSSSKTAGKSAKERLFIEDYGPRGSVVAESRNPTFYVIFSKPVRGLSALEAPSETSDIMNIEPPLKGVFRWYGNQHLSFEASEGANPAQVYTVTVSKDVRSVDGDKLDGDFSFSTTAEALKLRQVYAGYIKEGENEYDSESGLAPAKGQKLFVRLNYQIPVSQFRDFVTFSYGGTEDAPLSVHAEPYYSTKWNFNYYGQKTEFDEAAGTANTFIVTVDEELLPARTLVVATKNQADKKTFSTLRPFRLKKVENYADYSTKTRANPLTLSFTQRPDIQTVLAAISFSDDDSEVHPLGGFRLSEKNVAVEGKNLIIYDLPVDFDEKHRLALSAALLDVFGQPLSEGEGGYSFRTRSPQAYIHSLDAGSKIMEATYPHRFIIEYQNLNEGSQYAVSAARTPYLYKAEDDVFGSSALFTRPEIRDFNTSARNVRQFEEIDLDPFLTDGYGTVFIKNRAEYEQYSYWQEEYYTQKDSSDIAIQVTNLGVTARIALNKCVVLVTALDTGKPVADADVYVMPYESDRDIKELFSEAVAQGKTNKDGLAVITLTEKQVRQFENRARSDRRSPDMIFVQKDADSVVFRANSHSTWRDGIRTSAAYDARRPVQHTFMFVDRGLYRPGETVTFRGIDRNQVLGNLQAYKGGYTISSRGNWWDSTAIIEPLEGTVSESGGFTGSFKLPDDLEPGSYRLEYMRTTGGDPFPSVITFTVAEFERLKIQASASIPDVTYYGGDQISAQVTATYLAGGALGGADYRAAWYRSKTEFRPSTAETKGFRFGPGSSYSSIDYFNETNGVLDSAGGANVSCKTEKISEGMPYSYRVDAAITDVSNQRVSAGAQILVHPALFYVGVKRPDGMAGFAKKGQRLEFPYILVTPEGQKIPSVSVVSELNYKLVRKEWQLSQEKSVNSSVYTRYTEVDVTDSEGSVRIADSGRLSLVPSESGWYTLTLSGKDRRGNSVLTEYGFYVTGGNARWYSDNSGSISLTPDQSEYNPGDTAKILLESPLPSGDYLITVEREGIFSEEVRHLDSPASVLDVRIAGSYVPVVYVAVSSYSVRTKKPELEYGDVDLDKPKGYFGVTAVRVNPYVRAFSVAVECDKPSYRPGDEVTVTLTATKAGTPVEGAELTLMAVDRGVLDLINYHVPNPIEFFYNNYNFPLRVFGGDSREYLMDPVTYSVKNLAGGDSDTEEDDKDEDERKDFRPTAVFEPVLVTGKDGTARCTFKMPDSLTTYRITAFGVRNDLFALQESEVSVQNPINIQQVQPRKLRERDTAECGVLITNLSEKDQKVTVTAAVRVPEGNTVQDEQEGRLTVPGAAFIDGAASHTVNVISGDSTVVYFDVGAQSEGTVELVYTITSDVLNERLVSPIRIEKTYVYETVTMTSSVTGDKKAAQTEYIAIPGFAKDAQGELKFILDATRLGPLASAVDYVFRYPYGCLEQQSAKVLPLVIFEEYIDVFGLNSEVGDVHKCVTTFTKKWAKSQLADGGFPYWPDGTKSSAYVSARIAQVCALAKERGYSDRELGIDIAALTRYLENLTKEDWAQTAYNAYVLALLGSGRGRELASSVIQDKKNQGLSALAYAALAMCRYGDTATAKSAADEIRRYLQPVERSVTVLEKPDAAYNGWFGTNSDSALVLQLLVTLDPDDKMVDRLLFTLLQEKSARGYWHNTAGTSRVLEAVWTYIKARKIDSTNYTAKVTLDKDEVMTARFKGAGAKPESKILAFDDAPLKDAPRDAFLPVEFGKDGNGSLYYTVEMKYALPDEMQGARDEGIKLTYRITETASDSEISLENPVVELESGKTYRVTLDVETPRNRTYLALRAPIPSGAEILDSTFVTSGMDAKSGTTEYSYGHWLSNKTIYDNEIQFFWDYFGSGHSTVTYTFRTARRGVYPTPPVQGECMYEPEIFGRTDGCLFVIK